MSEYVKRDGVTDEMEKLARRKGWNAKNTEWYCPECTKLVEMDSKEEQP